MAKVIKSYAFILLLLLPYRSFADHLFGGELTYTHVTGLTYRITVSLYSSCGTNDSAFNLLYTAKPAVDLYDGELKVDTLQLVFDPTTGNEITPVCSAYSDSTTCKSPPGPIPGVKKFVYSSTYTLPNPSANWRMIFNGDLTNFSLAGRSTAITNILLLPGNPQIMWLVAELNNAVGPNSSPQLTTIPTPFYCVNTPQQYNQGAVDSENDSLVFSLAPALNSGFPVPYLSGFSEINPISTFNGQFLFNSLNGQMDFTPDIVQNALIVNKVTEYRNGVKVGSSTREMTFVVLSNCQNMIPAGSIDTSTLIGGTPAQGTVINVCKGEPVVSFSYPLTDAEGDLVNVTHTTLPAGATLNIIGNNTSTPLLTFNWNTASVAPGIYNFFVHMRDSHCPLNGLATQAFTIRVINAMDVVTTMLKPTNCAHKAIVAFNIMGGTLPRTLTIRQNGNAIKTIIDSTGTAVDSFVAGNYTITTTLQEASCSALFSFTIPDSGIFPFGPMVTNSVFCIGNDPEALNAIPYPGATVNWFELSGNPLSGAPSPPTTVDTTLYWLISQTFKTCTSAMDTVAVIVTPKPDIRVLQSERSVCYGDKIFLVATGASNYTWLPEKAIFREPDSTPFIRVYQPSQYSVIGTNESGCRDTIAFSFTDIQECCKISYPNAFTPNNDNRNDGWSPVMYGNHSYYELSIYNRWGTRLFHSFTPNAQWNGIYEGQPQEIGTYFYHVKVKCLTGQEETNKGELILIR